MPAASKLLFAIAIEARPTWYTMEKYEGYKSGEYANIRDERYTLGMRIARDMDLDTLYPPRCHSADQRPVRKGYGLAFIIGGH